MSEKPTQKSATFDPSETRTVGVRDLRDHLSAFLERVKAGETITVTEHGRPIARLVREEPVPQRILELAAQGQLTLATQPRRRWEDIPHFPYPWSIEELMDEIR
jgi:prevent-host-death family protein